VRAALSEALLLELGAHQRDRFYRWALRQGHVRVNPIPQTSRRPVPVGAGWAAPRDAE
jgi:hypothetical protein